MKYNGLWMGAVSLLMAGFLQAGDWSQLHGPNRNGAASADEPVPALWTADGPSVRWSRPVGDGYAGPVVVGDRVWLFHRVGAVDRLEAFSVTDGQSICADEQPSRYVDRMGHHSGPRAVPAVDDQRVFAFGADGVLRAVDRQTGKRIWTVDTADRYGSEDGFFGRVCSPLVEGDQVVVQVGGPKQAGIVAFDRATGEQRWHVTDHEAGYASPVAATMKGRRELFCLTREGLVVIDPKPGRVLFERRFRAAMHASVNAATPIIVDDSILLTASYETGAALLRRTGDGVQERWASDEAISSQYVTPVVHDGFIYGVDGREASGFRLRCVEWATGRVRWTVDPFAVSSLILVRDHLLILTERGELILAPASPEAFAPVARAQVLGHGTRAYPALANKHFYARDPRRLSCFKMSE